MKSVSLEHEMLSLVSKYSDWRIYPNDVSRCSALPSPRNFDGNEHDRNWVLFESLKEMEISFVQIFMNECVSRNEDRGFEVNFFSAAADKLKIRVEPFGDYFAGRFIYSDPKNLDELDGVTSEVRDFIMSTSLSIKGGLVLMAGNAGTGKSVFAHAAMRHRLLQYGGHLVVAGDPPEQPVGDNGLNRVGKNGYVDVVDIGRIGFSAGLAKIMRSYPAGKKSYLLFNEIRMDSNAFDLVNIALNGQTVFSTIHASTADAALDRLVSWCIRSGLDIDLVRNMIAQSLFGITMHKYEMGNFKIFPNICNEETRKKIREGSMFPFQSSAPLKF